jgi:flavin-dependent dehydrogenase
VNIGLGIQQKQTSKSLQRLLDEWIARSPLLNGIRPLIENGNLPGTWPVSVRHQNDCLVANGFMIAGDSAWAANPISAGGMGPSIIGGILAGETAVEAVEQKDVSEAALWRYNLRYVNTYGRKTAALEAFRVYLQSLDNLEINYGMKYFLTPEQAESLLSSEVYDLSLLEKLVSAARAMTVTMHGHASLLRGLYFTHKRMQELNRLYEEYPEEPRKYPAWKKKVDSILSEVKRRFSH